MTLEQLFACLLIIFVTVANAAADGIMIRWIYRPYENKFDFDEFLKAWSFYDIKTWTRAQWFWHGFKWFFFYIPLLVILEKSHVQLFHTFVLGFVCYFLWSFVYKYEKLYQWIFGEDNAARKSGKK